METLNQQAHEREMVKNPAGGTRWGVSRLLQVSEAVIRNRHIRTVNKNRIATDERPATRHTSLWTDHVSTQQQGAPASGRRQNARSAPGTAFQLFQGTETPVCKAVALIQHRARIILNQTFGSANSACERVADVVRLSYGAFEVIV